MGTGLSLCIQTHCVRTTAKTNRQAVNWYSRAAATRQGSIHLNISSTEYLLTQLPSIDADPAKQAKREQTKTRLRGKISLIGFEMWTLNKYIVGLHRKCFLLFVLGLVFKCFAATEQTILPALFHISRAALVTQTPPPSLTLYPLVYFCRRRQNTRNKSHRETHL